MPTNVYTEVANATGYSTRVGTGVVTPTVTTSCFTGKQNASGVVTEWRTFMSYDTSDLDGLTLVSASFNLNLDTITTNGSPPALYTVMCAVGWDILGGSLPSTLGPWNSTEWTDLEDVSGMSAGDNYEVVFPDPVTDWVNQVGCTDIRLRYTTTMLTDSTWKGTYFSNRSNLTVVYLSTAGVPVVQTFGGVCG